MSDSEQEGRTLKTVLVTGGSGFIGRHIIRSLAAQGHRVFATEHLTRISEPIRACCDTVIANADALNARHFLSTLRHCDAVIHAAALVPSDMGDLEYAWDCLTANAMATLALAEAAREASVPRFIYLSTAQMYRHPPSDAPYPRVEKNKIYMVEPAPAPRTERHEIYPVGFGAAYFASKWAGEVYAQTGYGDHGTAVILRLGTVYGPRGHSVIDKFRRQAESGTDITVYGEGSARFNPVAVEDVAMVAEKALYTGEGVYNVVSGEYRTVLEVAWTIAEKSGATVINDPSIPDGNSFPPVSNDAARRQWGIKFKSLHADTTT